METTRTRPIATILIVEDETAILFACQRMLEREGHTVLAARSGDEALHIAKIHFGRIDLLVTDVCLPTINGAVLYQQLRVYRPNMLVLYMSGYTEENFIGRGVLAEGARMLEKPFTFAELASVVRLILSP